VTSDKIIATAPYDIAIGATIALLPAAGPL
jgi:hypothetical protein